MNNKKTNAGRAKNSNAAGTPTERNTVISKPSSTKGEKTVEELANAKEVKELFASASKAITDMMQILHINQLTFNARYTSEKNIKIEWEAKR
jgi:hypothetical protein